MIIFLLRCSLVDIIVKRRNDMNITVVRSLKLVVMYCSGSFNADELRDALEIKDGDELKLIGLPCSGKVDMLYLAKAFEKGADGLALLTCPANRCQHLEGNLRASRRMEGLNSLMEEAGFGKERMVVLSPGDDGLAGVAAEMAEFSGRIRGMQINPSGIPYNEVAVFPASIS